jgi:hypothetical protein
MPFSPMYRASRQHSGYRSQNVHPLAQLRVDDVRHVHAGFAVCGLLAHNMFAIDHG